MSSIIKETSQPVEPLFQELLAPFEQLSDDYGTLKGEIQDILIASTPNHGR